MVIVTVDVKSGKVIAGREIVTRGWVHATEAEDLLEEARRRVVRAIEQADDTDFDTLKRTVRKSLAAFVNERTKRKPMIVPVVMEA